MRIHNWISAFSVLSAMPLYPLAAPQSPHWDDIHVKHTWKAVPTKWETLGHPPPDTTIDLYIALKPHRENALADALYEVSDPMDPKYGAYLSKEQVAEIVAPHPDTLGLINSWLERHSIPLSSVSVSHGGSWLTLTGVPVSRGNAPLDTSYQLYEHAETKDRILRTLSYGLPAVLHAHVRTVVPTTYFDSPSALRKIPQNHSDETAPAMARSASGEFVRVLSGRADPVTPETIRTLYNTWAYVPRAADRNLLGIVGYLGDYPLQEDLTVFMRKYRADGAGATFAVVRIGEGDHASDPEANVDIQYTVVIDYPTRQIFYTISGSGDPFEKWLNYINRLPNVPQTISMSYNVVERNIPKDYAIALCDQIGQLGLRGVSVVCTSSNDGVGSGDCSVDDDSGRVQFMHLFPGTCPYVTGVGGTTSTNPEIAAPFSSGGFSNHFDRPRFQESTVPFFLQQLGNRYQGLYNNTGRGYPDLAAQSEDFTFIYDGKAETFRGTSCAAPTVAGVISLLNDYRLSINKPPLGWLNPCCTALPSGW